MRAISEIEADLDWREAELAVLRIFLSASNVSEREKKVIFRAAWALLYAHYEGFCKFALTVYFDRLEKSGAACGTFSARTQCFALSSHLKNLRTMPSLDLLTAVKDLEIEHLGKPAKFPEIDTKSNLSPNVLEELLAHADLSIPSLSRHRQRLTTLVRRRNKIAHGERDMIEELAYYLDFESAIKDVVYELAFAIDEKLDGA